MELVLGYDFPEEIRSLFTEYTTMLVEMEPAFQEYLDIQHYDDEVLDVTVKYGLPHGRLYLARIGKEIVGCIALRRLNDSECELKRLYVRPAWRRQGIAARLIDQIFSDARSIGYKRILLDTLPGLTVAIAMYRDLGFQDIPRYNNSPLDDTVFLGLDL